MSEPIITKQCTNCKQIKPLSEFYKHPTCKDGYLKVCKDCKLKYQKKYSHTKRGKDAGRKAMERYGETEKGKATHKRYRQTKKYKAACARYVSSKKGRAAIKARQVANSAIKGERLPSPKSLPCHYCSCPADEYHHPSYAPEHWLDVVPVCVDCHRLHNHSNSVIKQVSNLANPIFS